MTPSGSTATRELTPRAQASTTWFRHLARALRVFRLYRSDNPVVVSTQEAVTAELAELLPAHGGWLLRFSPSEIFLDDEPVVSVTAGATGTERPRSITDSIPFLFYRDGLRRITLQEDAPRHELEIFVQILRMVGTGGDAEDDLVTLLWQANLTSVQIEAVPLEQIIYLNGGAGDGGEGARDATGQLYALSPSGAEIRADLGSAAGPQGLHRDTFDDWILPETFVEVPEAFARLEPGAEAARVAFVGAREREAADGWSARVPEFLRGLRTLDDSEEMQGVLAHSAASWLTAALQGADWVEATRALELLNELDPERRLAGGELAAALGAIDGQQLTDRFDEGDAGDLSRFAAFVVGVGAPAVGLCVDVMSRAERARVRAATVTALCYLCADDPELLAPWLLDSRWHVVRNVVFVLGHIGGATVGPMLQAVSRHPEVRVRRQLVQALGTLPPEVRGPLLIEQLDTRDPQLLAATLNILTRDRDARTARAILACISAPDFDSRGEDNQRALFNALGEVADDAAVPALEALLNKGGWFARRTLQRVAAARTLRRIGTPTAMAVLEAGSRAHSEAVRSAALEAIGARGRA